VVAVGDCGANCGVFRGSYAVAGSVADIIPVDLTIPGCPPDPVALIKGLMALVESSASR
jgi:Ni,Fe-hydrogenase III small subunit